MNIVEAINHYLELKPLKNWIESVEPSFFFEFAETVITAYEKEKEKNKKIEIIVNKLMPLAECSYWNYENHTCTHTCRGCDYLNEDNKRTSSGILIDKDRYCRLYEDGNAEKDTKFVNVEDLINRHLKEE